MKNIYRAIAETAFVAFIILFLFWLLFPEQSPSGWIWFAVLLLAIFTNTLSDE